MLVSDLDHETFPAVTARLSDALAGAPIARRVMVIPVQAIEARLPADHEAVNRAFELRSPI
jgi:hypothetical protein